MMMMMTVDDVDNDDDNEFRKRNLIEHYSIIEFHVRT